MWRLLRQMPQRLALHVNKRVFSRRMHHLQDECLSVGAGQMEIVVVFARQRLRRSLNTVELAHDADSFSFGDGWANAGLKRHATNTICKRGSASIPDGCGIAGPLFRLAVLLLEFFSLVADGNRTVHGGKANHGRPDPVFDPAIVIVPGLAKMRASPGTITIAGSNTGSGRP